MKFNFDYAGLDPKTAMELQQKLRARLVIEPFGKPIRHVAGVDVSVKGDLARAAVVILSYPELALVETALAERPVEFPYIPGLLAFREIPVIMEAWRKLKTLPDAAIVDGQGYAHPRRFGLACHLGVVAGAVTIGCAKSRLVGEYEDPAPERGAISRLVHEGEVIGAVVRTRDNVKPVFISVGDKIDLDGAIKIILECARGRRLPEPVAMAHKAAGGLL
ncbi:MAG: endonuclease V [Nitrospinae bacterium]|nr:endonuclease V [Nitrospinota bacterium]